MPVHYSIDVEHRLVRITAVGTITPEEDRQVGRAWSSDPNYLPGMAILVDNRSRAGGATPSYVRAMVSTTRRHARLFEGTRCAVVVSRDVQFGMTRMYELGNGDGPLQARPFRSIEEAEAWLGVAHVTPSAHSTSGPTQHPTRSRESDEPQALPPLP